MLVATKKSITVAEAGRLGGLARRKNMTPEERSANAANATKARNQALDPVRRAAIARKAAQARWKKAKKAGK